jgi:hypothetical protein
VSPCACVTFEPAGSSFFAVGLIAASDGSHNYTECKDAALYLPWRRYCCCCCCCAAQLHAANMTINAVVSALCSHLPSMLSQVKDCQLMSTTRCRRLVDWLENVAKHRWKGKVYCRVYSQRNETVTFNGNYQKNMLAFWLKRLSKYNFTATENQIVSFSGAT